MMVNLFRRLNTVFYKLIISYITLITLSITIVGFLSFHYFSTNFNREVEKVHQGINLQLSQLIEANIVRKAEELFVHLIINEENSALTTVFFKHGIVQNHAKIHDIHELLKNTASSYPTLIDNIQIHYKKNNMVISSRRGLQMLEGPQDMPSWAQYLNQSNSHTEWWMESPQSNNVVFIRTYPYHSAGINQRQGYIAIEMKKNALIELLLTVGADSANRFGMVNSQGTILIANPYFREPDKVPIQQLLSSRKEAGSFVDTGSGEKTILSYQTIPRTDWILYSATPVEAFYTKSQSLQNTLLLICISVIILGLIISHIFTFRIYSPIKSILAQFRGFPHRSGESEPSPSDNEFVFINQVIDQLSVKVNRLEMTLDANMPVIKHNLVSGLIYQKLRTLAERDEKLGLLGLKFDYRAYRVAVLHFLPSQIDALHVENKEFVKYNVIEYIESQSDSSCLYLAADTSSYEICIIAGLPDPSHRALHQTLNLVISYIHANFMIEASAVIGTPVQQAGNIHLSFETAVKLKAYLYFHPAKRIVISDHFSHREESKDLIPYDVLSDFEKALKSHNMERIKAVLQNLVEMCKNGNYTAEHCHQRWTELVAIFHLYLKQMNVKSTDILDLPMQNRFKRIANVTEFMEWLLQTITVAYHKVDEKSNRTHEWVVQAKSFIEEHLDAPLSLDFVADRIHVSSRHLSKIFKEETGINFTDYVTQKRVKRAADFLLNSEGTIEEIAQKTGFGSATYFIKKFKEYHGDTPNNYRKKRVSSDPTM